MVSMRYPRGPRDIGAAFPAVAAVGVGAAAYLTYIELSGGTGICGPVGDCHTVQESPYAVLFGVIPVGALGLAGYVVMTLGWIVSRASSGPASNWAKLSLLGMTVAGTLFSIYLTFLEPFVIGATCAWCLTSAVATTALMWLSAAPAKYAWATLR